MEHPLPHLYNEYVKYYGQFQNIRCLQPLLCNVQSPSCICSSGFPSFQSETSMFPLLFPKIHHYHMAFQNTCNNVAVHMHTNWRLLMPL